MATTSAVGNGPVEFTDDNGGQVSIPLSALRFEDGVLTIPKDSAGNYTTWPPYANYTADTKTLIANLLNYLAAQRLIVPAVAASPKPALVIKAADPGPPGNNIGIAITVGPSNRDPTQITFDVAVTETDDYSGLKVANITNKLGTNQNPLASPGLVRVVDGSVDITLLPKATIPTTPYTLAISAGGTRARADILDPSGKTVFTLEAKHAGLDGALTKVWIPAVDAGNGTFALKAYWTKTMSPPAAPTLTPSPSGGLLKTGTYYYKVAAVVSGLEQLASAEASTPVTGPHGSVSVAFTTVIGASSYKVYRGTIAGGENMYYTTAASPFVDTGGAGTPGTPISLTIVTVQQVTQSNLSYEITISPPPSGVFSVPRDTGGTPVQLSGGADGTPASATIFASQ